MAANPTYALQSYDLKGVKESFANWVSNLSPTDTPFVSLTGKEAISNSLFQWQEDSLAAPNTANAVAEGSVAAVTDLKPTTVVNNKTQILRKVVKVSDTANALANYGRGQELQYQMEKAGKEIKRDLEAILLSAQAGVDGTAGTGGAAGTAQVTKGFVALVAATTEGIPEDTALKVHQEVDPTGAGFDFEKAVAGVTEVLYTAGADTNTIMFHPSLAKQFSKLMEKSGGERQRMFDGAADTKVNTYVSTYIDPLGQEFKLLPNRFMPKDSIYIFSPSDWTQMVLRAPQRTKLAKDGSYEKWMIEMEVGLRHRNRFASGILKFTKPIA